MSKAAKNPLRQAATYKQLVARQRARVRVAAGVCAASLLLIGLAFIRDWHSLVIVFGLILLVTTLVDLQTARWRARDYAHREADAVARAESQR